MNEAVKSLEDFVGKIRQLKPSGDEKLLYRGHRTTGYELRPIILREKQEHLAKHEHDLLHELIASHPEEFAQDTTVVEQLARAQHYGLPTRLLDMTWNPLVALYFAVKEFPESGKPNEENPDGEVIVLRVAKDLVKFYNSHTVACIANLAYLKDSERQKIRELLDSGEFNERNIPAFNEARPVVRLLDSIREEKPYFYERINPHHLSMVMCVQPKRSIQRLVVQAGALLLWGLVDDLGEAEGIDEMERIRVDGAEKSALVGELDRLEINPRRMYPEIDKAAGYIKVRN